MAYIWGLFKQNITLDKIVDSGSVISFAAKWHHSDEIMFHSDFHDGHDKMLEAAHGLLSEADVVVHYNGTPFDIPCLNREFLISNMLPPAPFQQVDLLKHVRKNFRFTSNKLDYVCQALGIGEKVHHSGFQLWLDCMAGDSTAWGQMKAYNQQDVVITEALYDRLAPWINAPSISLYSDDEDTFRCTNCGSKDLQSRGHYASSTAIYRRYQCQGCGKWMRAKTSERTTEMRAL